jgi:hypothetical protein
MKLSRTNILLIILGAVVVLAAIYYLIPKNDANDGVVIATSANGIAGDAEAVFINLGSQIESIGFDVSFFNDPRFMALVDIGVAVVPEREGRKDPFGPLGFLPVER